MSPFFYIRFLFLVASCHQAATRCLLSGRLWMFDWQYNADRRRRKQTDAGSLKQTLTGDSAHASLHAGTHKCLIVFTHDELHYHMQLPASAEAERSPDNAA